MDFDSCIPGGYLRQNPKEPEIQKMADKAISLLQQEFPDVELKKIHHAATQVVAGTNYCFIVECQTPNSHTDIWQLIMYEDFAGNCSLEMQKKL